MRSMIVFARTRITRLPSPIVHTIHGRRCQVRCHFEQHYPSLNTFETSVAGVLSPARGRGPGQAYLAVLERLQRLASPAGKLAWDRISGINLTVDSQEETA
jgi:hypothetical protein